MQYVTSVNVSPYKLKETGDGPGVSVDGPDVSGEGLGELAGRGVEVCSGEHAKRRKAKVVANRDTLIFIL